MDNFKVLVNRLTQAGFRVSVDTRGQSEGRIYRFASVTGGGIRGGFCDFNYKGNRYLEQKFAADHENCFDKWSKCPFVVPIDYDWKELLEHLAFLGSEEGERHSSTFEYLDNPRLPLILE